MYIYIYISYPKIYTYIHEWSRCRKADRESSSGIQQCPRCSWSHEDKQLVRAARPPMPMVKMLRTLQALEDELRAVAVAAEPPGGCMGDDDRSYATARSGLFWYVPEATQSDDVQARTTSAAGAGEGRPTPTEGQGQGGLEATVLRGQVLQLVMENTGTMCYGLACHKRVSSFVTWVHTQLSCNRLYIYISQLFLLIIPYHHVIYVVTINSTKHQFGPNKLR